MIEKSPKSETGSAVGEQTPAASVGERDRAGAGRLFEVVIAGVPLRLKSSHDEQTVNELVDLVDAKVREPFLSQNRFASKRSDLSVFASRGRVPDSQANSSQGAGALGE